jgi:hypothetical protein
MATLPPEVYGETPTALSYIPADATLTQNNADLGAQSECVLGSGRNAVAGTSAYGFSDTSYLPTTTQILRATTTGQY